MRAAGPRARTEDADAHDPVRRHGYWSDFGFAVSPGLSGSALIGAARCRCSI
jgi:hypothetical protein